MKDVYDKFGLEAGTRDFIGHAMALYPTDGEYIDVPGKAPEAIERIRLYGNSVARYGKSPYIYPLYGLGELPQGFARLSAIYGGTYMLNTHVDEILYEGDKAVGIKATMAGADGMSFETKSKMILGDPSYFPGKVKVVGHVLRAICILNHPLAGTSDSDSCQLIIPQHQVGRKNGKWPCIDVFFPPSPVSMGSWWLTYLLDIYIATVSSSHNVCPKGYWIAIVSTIAETSANHHLELQPGLERLGKIEEQFMVCFIFPKRLHLSRLLLKPRGNKYVNNILTCYPRDPLSPSTSRSRMAPRTTSISPRATMPPATLRLRRTTSRISTAAALERSSLSRASGRVSTLRSKAWRRGKKVKEKDYLMTSVGV